VVRGLLKNVHPWTFSETPGQKNGSGLTSYLFNLKFLSVHRFSSVSHMTSNRLRFSSAELTFTGSELKAMPAVAEKMQQRAQGQEHKWQRPQEMGPVFREQKEPGDQEKTDEYPISPGLPPVAM
jgi:hypothetical protein